MDWLSALLADPMDQRVGDAAADAARQRSPRLAALPEEEIQRHARAVVEATVEALAAEGEPGERHLQFAERLGTDRAHQGVSVDALLDGFQGSRARIVEIVVERGRAAGISADDLLDGLTRLDRITTVLESRMVHAHRAAELDMARTRREAHAQVLRRVLLDEPGDRTPLDASQRYRCLVSDVSDPATAARIERALANVLAEGVAGFIDGRFAALVVRPPRLDRDHPTMIAAPPAQLDEIPTFYGLCRRALLAAGNEPGLHDLTDLALATVTVGNPQLGRLLASSLLPTLKHANEFHRLLAETVLAHLDNAGRLESTAQHLHVHPNTVKYRVKRFIELTGRHPTPSPGTAVTDTAQLWWALQTWLRQ
jgi:DNA-binding PucR family transcriptional regulator